MSHFVMVDVTQGCHDEWLDSIAYSSEGEKAARQGHTGFAPADKATASWSCRGQPKYDTQGGVS